MAQVAPYGAWTSPIGAERVMGGSSRLGEVAVTDDAVWWSELRPTEGGRTQIVRRSPNGELADVLPAGVSAQSSVHEYGGGAWWLAGETVFFVRRDDQRIWRLDPGFDPTPVTPVPLTPRGLRYADAQMTPDLRWIVCVQEAHPGEAEVDSGATEAVNRLVAIPATGGVPVVLRQGADFVMSPRLDHTGELLAWVEWSHPDMPWDSTELHVGRLDPTGLVPTLSGVRHLVGGRGAGEAGDGESIVQPEWDHDGRLWFCSDRTDWWNLYRYEFPGPPSGEPVPVAAGAYEVALPAWVFGESRYAFLSDNRVVFAFTTDGVDHLAVYDTIADRVDRIAVPCTSIHQVRAWQTTVVFVGGSFTTESAVVATVVGRGGACSRLETMGQVADAGLSSSLLSVGQPITFPTDGGIAHGIFYPPTNSEFVAPEGTRPPLIVTIHGGPTSAANAELNLRVQFWTSRGFAVVDVNHRGSTGFGRRYRNELRGQWGVADVADCIAAARFLAGAGRADGDRLVIRGGSAGGFTTLAALTFSDAFSAGCSLYGIADLELLMADDHKFESQYTVSLVAPYPEGVDVYRERSPIHHLEGFTAPLIIFQGTEDKVVPPNQAQLMVDALAARGVPYSAVFFEGEGHGFRQAANIVRCLEAELSFYAQVLGFPEPEGVTPVVVENLP
ncbi:MAG: prolyl oligopeptidase family serine peptidase [Acidimicrobiales bacterium]